eukprot:356857-Chlamydomonas_euryale.AAC.1
MHPCTRAPMRPRAHAPVHPRAHAPMHPRAHAPTRPCAHAPIHPCAHALVCPYTHAPTRPRNPAPSTPAIHTCGPHHQGHRSCQVAAAAAHIERARAGRQVSLCGPQSVEDKQWIRPCAWMASSGLGGADTFALSSSEERSQQLPDNKHTFVRIGRSWCTHTPHSAYLELLQARRVHVWRANRLVVPDRQRPILVRMSQRRLRRVNEELAVNLRP